MYKIALIVGSNRRNSINRKLAQALAKLGEGSFAFETVQIDDLPMYNEDLESDLPPSVRRFKAAVDDADALLVVTPEHNRSIPAVLKNAIDWGTRPYGQNVWDGKPAAIAGASPGAVGTAVAQQHLRQILGDLGAVVMGGEAYIAFRPELLGEDGDLIDNSTRAFLGDYVDRFASLVARLVPAYAPRQATATA